MRPSFADFYSKLTPGARQHVSLLVILSWIAACDGDIADEETECLVQMGGDDLPRDILDALIAVGRDREVEALHLAVETIRRMTVNHRELVLTIALGMTLADRKMTFAESSILRFLEDAWGLPVSFLQGRFKEATDQDFPAVSDPSDPSYFFNSQERSNGGQNDQEPPRTNRSQQESKQQAPRRSGGMSRSEAAKILGVDSSATPQQARDAYVRLAKIHHPDRFEALGDDMKSAATVIFSKIQSAYDRLSEAA